MGIRVEGDGIVFEVLVWRIQLDRCLDGFHFGVYGIVFEVLDSCCIVFGGLVKN